MSVAARRDTKGMEAYAEVITCILKYGASYYLKERTTYRVSQQLDKNTSLEFLGNPSVLHLKVNIISTDLILTLESGDKIRKCVEQVTDDIIRGMRTNCNQLMTSLKVENDNYYCVK